MDGKACWKRATRYMYVCMWQKGPGRLSFRMRGKNRVIYLISPYAPSSSSLLPAVTFSADSLEILALAFVLAARACLFSAGLELGGGVDALALFLGLGAVGGAATGVRAGAGSGTGAGAEAVAET